MVPRLCQLPPRCFVDAKTESGLQSHPAAQIHSPADPARVVARVAGLAFSPSGCEASQSAPDRQPAIPARRPALPALPHPEISAASAIGVPRVVDRHDQITQAVGNAAGASQGCGPSAPQQLAPKGRTSDEPPGRNHA